MACKLQKEIRAELQSGGEPTQSTGATEEEWYEKLGQVFPKEADQDEEDDGLGLSPEVAQTSPAIDDDDDAGAAKRKRAN